MQVGSRICPLLPRALHSLQKQHANGDNFRIRLRGWRLDKLLMIPKVEAPITARGLILFEHLWSLTQSKQIIPIPLFELAIYIMSTLVFYSPPTLTGVGHQ
jgi:hypothetical protein